MGHVTHHAVLVFSDDYNEQPDIEQFRADLPEAYRHLVVGPIPATVNSTISYAFMTSGSKDGWEERDKVAEMQERFRQLFAFAYDDGSSPHQIVTVQLGEEAPQFSSVSIYD